MKSVAILRSNPVSPDPRVKKVAQALHNVGWKVIIFGWDRSTSLPAEEKTSYAFINRLAIRATYSSGLRNIFPLFNWQIMLLIKLFKWRNFYSYIHACDFDTILPALFMKAFFGKKVVYDIFDFYAGRHTIIPATLKSLIKKIDLWSIKKADGIIIADDIRRQQILGSCPKKIEVIYNSPEEILTNNKNANLKQRDHFKLQIAYIGILTIKRGLLEMLDILSRHPNWFLNLAGFGGGDERLIISKTLSLPNVKFHGKVDYEKALKISSRADVLFATYDPEVPNHKFSSPNKMFEAMMLGKPIIVARETGMDEIIKKYNLGYIINYGDVNELEIILSKIALWNKEKKIEFAKRVQTIFKKRYNWTIMVERLTTLYHDL